MSAGGKVTVSTRFGSGSGEMSLEDIKDRRVIALSVPTGSSTLVNVASAY